MTDLLPAIDIGQISEALNNKSDIDLGNITQEGKKEISDDSSPYSGYLTLTTGSSGSQHTTPDDGWINYTEMAVIHQYIHTVYGT